MSRAHRTCDELGVCQAEVGRPRCSSCVTHAYAPGVIQGYRRPLSFWAFVWRVTLGGAITGGLIGLALGYLVGRLG
ncbi:MAG: hypothetical protein KIS62_12325 [Ramlibacter sp.]|nr:hypothetical protein [Ramlibacter sp.]MCW5650524.1 hypothetical protein [Ramlibacter sp.]